MSTKRTWQEELGIVEEMMRELSLQEDPQAAAVLYAERLRTSGLIPYSERLSISRRNLAAPFYRITRSSRWKENIDPWRSNDRLPLFSTGLLGELLYAVKPTVIDDLPARLDANDPAIEYLRGFGKLISFPQFERGEALNMIIGLVPEGSDFAMEQVPNILWMANLWGRSVHNLVLRRELEKSHEELTAAHERLQAVNSMLDRELQIVGEIQQTLLPQSLPVVPGIELAAHYQTSQRAGGDYYDLFDCGDGTWGILIADVSGHGAPAAVIMAVTHAIAHLHPGCGIPPSELLAFVNSTLARHYTNGNGSFVTAFYGLYDSKTRQLRYARAGHNPPRLLRGGSVCSIEGRGNVPLGVSPEARYEESVQSLASGDLLLLYTDGITEARNIEREMFGTERLDKTLTRCAPTAQACVDRVLRELREFTGDVLPVDDQTLLAVGVK